MSGKGFRSVFQLGAEALHTTSRVPRTQHRAFSQSCQRLRYGPVPKFTNLSSPELQTLLTTLRETVILPAHLTKFQRDQIFKQRYKKDLLIDPIKIKVNDEEFTLKPLNVLEDIPPPNASLLKALDMMETSADFENVPRLMEGLKNARVNTGSLIIERVVKALGKKGYENVVLECARRGKDTGFDLMNDHITSQVLWWFHNMAVKTQFEGEATTKALKWSEQIFELLEDPTYKKSGDAIQKDPRVQARNVGVLLSLAVQRAKTSQEGKDVDGKVDRYAQRLLRANLELPTPKRAQEASFWLGQTFPLVYGFKNARDVLGKESAAYGPLGEVQKTLEAQVRGQLKAYEQVLKEPRTRSAGVKLYDQYLTGL